MLVVVFSSALRGFSVFGNERGSKSQRGRSFFAQLSFFRARRKQTKKNTKKDPGTIPNRNDRGLRGMRRSVYVRVSPATLLGRRRCGVCGVVRVATRSRAGAEPPLRRFRSSFHFAGKTFLERKGRNEPHLCVRGWPRYPLAYGMSMGGVSLRGLP